MKSDKFGFFAYIQNQSNLLLATWLVFAIYSACVIAFVQFFALPVLFPHMHAGQGLLAGGDSAAYHAMAAEIAAEIRESGWKVWSLAPQGQTAAGLAAPFYVLFGDAPASLIPVNAALHATSGTIVIQLLLQMGVQRAPAIAAAALWVAFPSTFQWLTQIQKDSYFFLGLLSVLLGWSMFFRAICDRKNAHSLFKSIALIGAGIFFAGAARLLSLKLLLPISIGFCLIALSTFIVRARQGMFSRTKSLIIVCVIVMIPAALLIAPNETRFAVPAANAGSEKFTEAGNSSDPPQWKSIPHIPKIIDRIFIECATARWGYLSRSYLSAGSMIDLDVQFHGVLEVLLYLPRATQIGLFAPFPSQWFTSGSSTGGSLMRTVASIETLIIYPLLIIGVPLGAWQWRNKPEFWLCLTLCLYFIIVFACVTPNLGTLYRLRYGFLMVLAGLGLAALHFAYHRRFGNRAHA